MSLGDYLSVLPGTFEEMGDEELEQMLVFYNKEQKRISEHIAAVTDILASRNGGVS